MVQHDARTAIRVRRGAEDGRGQRRAAAIGSAVELPFLSAIFEAFGGLAELGIAGLFVGSVVMAALLNVRRQ